MPRATGVGTRLRRYEEAWEGINRLIRQGGSWSGFERNCFFVQSAHHGLLNVSAVSGLDTKDDARAIAVWDYDRDGDADLIVKNRTGPQLRLWRNDYEDPGARIVVALRGKKTTVGARVTVRAGGREWVREVRAGSGFLTQESSRLVFGLGDAKEVDELEVRWGWRGHGGHGNLDVNRAYVIEEGHSTVESRPFLKKPSERSRKDLAAVTASAALPDSEGIWLIEPYDFPPIELTERNGASVDLKDWRGAPCVVNLWSPDCGVCVRELHEWSRSANHASQDGSTRIPVCAITGGDHRSAPVIKSWAGQVRWRFAFTAPEHLLTLGIVLEDIARWSRGSVLPVTFLVDAEGRIAKIYRGKVPWKVVRSDVERLGQPRTARRRLALPFGGRYFVPNVRRDYFQLGIAFMESGLIPQAEWAFQSTLKRWPPDVDSLYNLGLLMQQKGELESAGELYARALAQREDFVDAQVNLGSVLARRGRLPEARSHFEAALARRPDHLEALLNLGRVELSLGEPQRGLEHLLRAAKLEPNVALVYRELGTVYRRLGDLPRAQSAFERVTKLSPRDPEGWSQLGVILAEKGEIQKALDVSLKALALDARHAPTQNNVGLMQQSRGQLEEAEKHFRRAIEAAPELPGPYYNLARLLARQGRRGEGRKVLKQLLAVHPDHRAAREMLRRWK